MNLKQVDLDKISDILKANKGLQELRRQMGWPDNSLLAEAIKLRLLPFALGHADNIHYAVAITRRGDRFTMAGKDAARLDMAKRESDKVITHWYSDEFIVTYVFPQ